MKPRTIVIFLALLGAAGWWALRSVHAPESESRESSPAGAVSEPLATARSGDSPDRPTPVESTDPLARQAERLRDTAARLAMHRDEAKAKGAPEVAIRTLNAHITRVEHQLSALGADAPNEMKSTGTTVSRALLSLGSRRQDSSQ